MGNHGELDGLRRSDQTKRLSKHSLLGRNRQTGGNKGAGLFCIAQDHGTMKLGRDQARSDRIDGRELPRCTLGKERPWRKQTDGGILKLIFENCFQGGAEIANGRFRLDTWKHLLTLRGSLRWESLPRGAVGSLLVEAFLCRLDTHVAEKVKTRTVVP